MRLSLCMIARNESLTLAKCLTSVAGLVDEIILVDTGSSDETRMVAKGLGAQVHDFAWVEDFSAARNESLRHATGEWILWLDADEYLDEDNRRRIRDLIEGLPNENAAYLMYQRSPVESADSDVVLFEQCRLFRNDPAIRWQYRVHEQIQPAVERSGGTVRRTGIVIEHSGYRDAALFRRKLERNLGLLLIDDRERPNDPFTLMNLGWAYQNLGQGLTALNYYRQSLTRCDPRISFAAKLHSLLVRAELSLGQRQQALKTCRAARTLFPDDTELNFLEAVLLSEHGDLKGAEELFLRLLDERRHYEFALSAHPGMRGHMTRHNLARIYHAQGRNAEAEAQWQAALDEKPNSVRSLFELGKMFIEQDRIGETQRLIQRLDGLGPTGELAAGMLRAHSHLKRNDFPTARRLLESLIAAGPPALEPRVLLSQLLLRQGTDSVAAEKAWRSVLAINPSHSEAQRQLDGLLKRMQPHPVRVSLCMIVRNEEANLPHCLGSVAGLVDETIIVDTGSTDRTREVARQLGARVVDFSWQDSFAAARNESIHHATGDWILWLDADERLDVSNREKLQNLLGNLKDENTYYAMQQRSIIDSSSGEASIFEQVRLFRNQPNIRWYYRVHEQILPALEQVGSMPRFTDVVIDHLGYEDRHRYQRKQERNLCLLLKQDEEEPNDSLTQFNLGLTLLTLGKKSEARGHLHRSLELAPPNGSWVRKLYSFLSGSAADLAESLGWCQQGLARFPDDTELLFQQASLLRAKGDLASAEAILLKLINSPASSHWAAGVDPGLRGYKARHNLAQICRSQQRFAEAEAQWREVLAEQASYTPAALSLGELFAAQKRWEELESVLNKLDTTPHGREPAARLRVLAQERGWSTPNRVELSDSQVATIDHDPGSESSAREIVPLVVNLLRPKSVIDLGCGNGAWLAAFRELGIGDIQGVDRIPFNRELLRIPVEHVLAHDLREPLRLNRRFDLALSLEVAEHLPAQFAASHVATLVKLAPVVLFSAAVPFQGGHQHVNEQWPGYWAKLFEPHGYLVLDCLRDKVWLNERVELWYRQNLLLFCRSELVESNAELRRGLASTSSSRLAMVHPRLFLHAINAIRELRQQLARQVQPVPPPESS